MTELYSCLDRRVTQGHVGDERSAIVSFRSSVQPELHSAVVGLSRPARCLNCILI